MGELLNDHETVDASGERVADSVNVVASKINKHDVFGAILDAVAEGLSKGLIGSGGFTTLDGASNGMGYNAAFLGFDKKFWGGSDKLEGGAIDVEEVWRGIDGAKVTINIEWMERCGS